MGDQLEQWLARLEGELNTLREHHFTHERAPWHDGFIPLHADLVKRLDRLESLGLKIAGTMIMMLAGIIGTLIWIGLTAERILQTKPP